MKDDVCNMEEIATIEIHKDGDRYYLNFITYGEISELLGVRSGSWKEKRISYKDIVALCHILRGNKKCQIKL